MAGENGGVYEIKTLPDWHGKLEEGQNSGKLVVADIWCEQCAIITPLFEDFSRKYEDVIFVKVVDVDTRNIIEVLFGIRGRSTVTAFRDGSLVGQADAANQLELEELIKSNRKA